MTPAIGRIVHYCLTADDAERINRRRDDARREWVNTAKKHMGIVIHVGGNVAAGDVFPMMIVRVYPDRVNGQVFLDGNDIFWAVAVSHGEGGGKYVWPPRV